MDERDDAEQPASAPAAKQVPIGLVRLRQTFVDPVRKNAKEIGAAGVVAGIAALIGGDDEAPPSDSGAGPSPTLRRMRWAALGLIAVLALVFLVNGLLR